ncbi:MAG: response regulator, partial [Bacteroidota bacterium]
MSSQQIRVLIVDDEPQIRRFLRASLGPHQYHLIEAATGTEALRLAASDHPNIIILDLGLPDIDGIEIISRIREWSHVPIIVLSVRGREIDKVEALDRGADDYVTKPFSIGELLARMRTALRHQL